MQPNTNGNKEAARLVLKLASGRKFGTAVSLEDARDQWISYRDRTGAGVSRIGNGLVVLEEGREVARISYNGRCWEAGGFDAGAAEVVLGTVAA